MTIAVTTARQDELDADGTQDNPFAAYRNRVPLGTISATTSLPDGAAENAATGTTYDYWLPDITGTTAIYRVTLGASDALTLIAIAAHNLGTLGGSVRVQKSVDAGVTWTTASPDVVPEDDTPIVFRLSPNAAATDEWRLWFFGLTAGDPLQVGVVFMGREIIFPTRFYKGFSPVISPTEVQFQSNVSQGGQSLSNSVVMQGSTLQASFQHLEPSFVRGEFLGFQRNFNLGEQFFFAWRPDTYPQDVYYGWRAGPAIRPANSDVLDLMTVQIDMRIHENE